MDSNKKIKSLVQHIAQNGMHHYAKKIKELGISHQDFKNQLHFSTKKYTRTCIAKDENFELLLLAWTKGQKTAIHNHADSECEVYVLDGKLKEVQYINHNEKLQEVSEVIFCVAQNTATPHDVAAFHSLENIGENKSLTLHLYSPPISKCLVHNAKQNKIEEKNLVYDFTA